MAGKYHLENFFKTIGTNLSNNITSPSHNCNITPTSTITSVNKSFFIKPMTISEVKHSILNLDKNKSVKSNCPAIYFLKISAHIISPILTVLFNNCINDGVFPKSLKSSEVIPIFKKGSKSLAGNYRPISLLSPFSKIFERHIHTQPTKFISKCSSLYKFKYGFRSNSSTEMALLKLCEEITTNMDIG